MPVEPIAASQATPDPQAGPAPPAKDATEAPKPMASDHFEKASPHDDPGAKYRALWQHAAALGSAAATTVGRSTQAISKAAPEIVDGAAVRLGGLIGTVLSMPGDVPHDAVHGYGVSPVHPAADTALEARRDARSLAKAMPVGVSVQTVNCNKPPRPDYDATRAKFRTTVKAQFVKHVAQTQPGELRRLGFSESQIKDMAKEAKSPKSLEVHHRLPVECGGTNDFDNLQLVRRDVHRYVSEAQMSATKGLEHGTSRQVELLMTEKGTMYPNVPNALNQPPFEIPK